MFRCGEESVRTSQGTLSRSGQEHRAVVQFIRLANLVLARRLLPPQRIGASLGRRGIWENPKKNINRVQIS
jgi:hypothetical protein